MITTLAFQIVHFHEVTKIPLVRFFTLHSFDCKTKQEHNGRECDVLHMQRCIMRLSIDRNTVVMH